MGDMVRGHIGELAVEFDPRLKAWWDRYCGPDRKKEWDNRNSSWEDEPPPRGTIAYEIWSWHRLDRYRQPGSAKKLRAIIDKLPAEVLDHLMPETDDPSLCERVKAARTQELDEEFRQRQEAIQKKLEEDARTEAERKAKEAEKEKRQRIATVQAEAERIEREKEAKLQETIDRKRRQKLAEDALGAELNAGRVASLRDRLRPVSAADFLAGEDPRPDWLVEGVMVAGEPLLIGGPKKSLKTSLAVDLAVSLVAGVPFLGHHAVPRPRSVLMYSGESGTATLRRLIRRVAAARGAAVADLAGRLSFSTALPDLSDASSLAALAAEAEPFDVVMVDPLYRVLGDAANITSLTAMGSLLGRAADALAGKTFILLHHTTKDTYDTGKLSLTQLAFAGVQEFARQWFLVNHRARFDLSSPTAVHKLVVTYGGSAGHFGAFNIDVDEGNLSDHRWQVTVSPYVPRQKKERADPARAEPAAAAADMVPKLVEVLPADGTTLSRRAIRNALGRNDPDTKRLIERAVADGQVVLDEKGRVGRPRNGRA